jgi:serine/threonine-protein kinase
MTTNDAPPSSSSPPVEVGAILAGKFRVDRVLGAGGMGVVLEATHLALHQRVAIKFLNQRGRENPDAVARFQREGRAAAKLRSKHVVRVMDVGALDDGQPYLVMELLEGRDLASVLKDGPLGVEEALDVMLQACDAVAEAHKAGIVHRDLKPGNIFLTTDNNGAKLVKVLDFGISKVDDDALSLTNTSEFLGSPLYMSPEHLRAARDVDPRSDVWSLGVILYEMLTGRRPFTGTTVPELVFNVLDTSPEAITTIRDDVPAHVAHAIEKCLAKERADRVASVAELVQMLAPDAPISKSLASSTGGRLAVSTSAGISRPPAELPEPTSRRSRRPRAPTTRGCSPRSASC